MQSTDDKGGKNYSYPALEKLIESIEDPERKELVTLIKHSPTRVEFNTTNEISNENEEDSIRQMYIENFDKTVELIKLPIEDLREKGKEVEEQSKELEEQGHL